MKTETNKIKKNGNEKIKQTYTEMNQIYKIYIYIYIYIYINIYIYNIYIATQFQMEGQD